jgi:hypothetical protein
VDATAGVVARVVARVVVVVVARVVVVVVARVVVVVVVVVPVAPPPLAMSAAAVAGRPHLFARNRHP